MAMSYTSLVAPKGTTGSLANWVNYSKLDTVPVLDEAQSLLFQLLRVREMRTEWTFGLTTGQSEIALPARFLDPIGRLYDVRNAMEIKHRIETEITGARAYDNSPSGDFGADPFTTTSGATTVSVELVGHDLTQGSTLTVLDANAVGGLTLNGTFPIISVEDDDNFTIETDAETAATSSATGGGSIATYTANKLIAGFPTRCCVVDEKLKLDCAMEEASQFKQLYYRAPKVLSATNLTNWLTVRYPKLLRVACMAAAADYMKDSTEYQKQLAALTALVGSTAAENDLQYRGAEFGTDTPTPGDYY
jgi:hypothetical protein